MDRWFITSVIVIICFLFLLFAELGLIPDYIISFTSSEFRGTLIFIALVILALAGIGILPMLSKKK